MAAIRELYLTSFFVLFSHISGQWSGNATIKQCGSSDLTITFNFSLGGENFYHRAWYLNSTSNKIADVNRTGFLTVEPPFISRLTLSGMSGITLSHVNSSDSGSYLFFFITDANFNLMTATTTVIINGMYDLSYSPKNVFCLFTSPSNRFGGLVVRASAPEAGGRGFDPRPSHTKDLQKWY
ncbi:hypothetical protein ACJMK2_022615 [Sinanodonta woodiana]|uniref:Uncharacterized protein n=1 Tax=Sinanodonta woodiana TaxID=1069815 RepID=A0ABD3TLM8_SINWO